MYFVIGILLFNLIIFKMSSRCSRIEENMYIKEYKKDID